MPERPWTFPASPAMLAGQGHLIHLLLPSCHQILKGAWEERRTCSRAKSKAAEQDSLLGLAYGLGLGSALESAW